MNVLTLRSLFEIFEPVNVARIREITLRDSRYPVHEIADKLIPYLKLLVERFNPDQVVLFGSYAYGNPTKDSDVDLLVVKKTEKSPREEASAIRKAFQPLRHSVANLAFDIMVRDPEDCKRWSISFCDYSQWHTVRMKTDENNPEDWYRSAKVRLGSADRLYPLEGTSESVIELLQESAERYLKGYLISKGWALSRIHDLGALIAEAQKYDERFGELTDQFWAMHYPGGEFDEQSLDFHEVRSRLDGLLNLIEQPL